jgi:hypothetical protein
VAGISSDPVFLGDGNFASSSKMATQGAIREVVGTCISFVGTWMEIDD